jgi:SAM-dependent methyltransferase
MYWRRYGTSEDDVDAGLELWEQRLYDNRLRRGDRVLLVGCGAGRDLLALAERGYEVTGLDPMPELVESAQEHLRRRGLNATVRQGFVEAAELNGPYDVVILAGCSYCYVSGTKTRISTLARLKTSVSARGLLIVTFAAAQRRSPLFVGMTRLASWLSGSDWKAEHGDSLSRGYFARRLLRYEHLFVPGEVARECAEAGWRLIAEEVNTPFHYVVAAGS